MDIPVLSIYGSEDKVLNMEQYNKSQEFIKNNFTETIINGGNHAQFGYYGNQSGDGTANISSAEQQNICVENILQFIKG